MKLFKKISPFIFALILLSSSFIACQKGGLKVVKIDEKFQLELGECISLKGEEFHICFDSVVEDSRCPPNVQCIWEGRLVIALIATTETGISQKIQVGDIFYEETNSTTIDDFLISAIEIEPHNREKDNLADEKYQLTFEVTKL